MLDALHRRLDAVGIRTTTARDALLGAVVAVLSVLAFLAIVRIVTSDAGTSFVSDQLVPDLSAARSVGACVVLVAQAMALTLRRRAPVLCLGLTVTGQLALLLVLPPFMSFQAPAGIVAVYSLGAYGPRRTALWGAGVTAVVQEIMGFVLGGADAAAALGVPAGTQLGGGLVSALVTYLGAALVGAYVGTRRELLAGLRAQVVQAEREREALAARVVLEERGRMARELHDVAAHHLSGIVVQASAAERLVDRDAERAKESLRWIRAQGRETLDNLRLVVGILREAGEPTGPAGAAEHGPSTPQPTLADVPELVDLARRTGTTVRAVTRGETFALAPAVELAVYRVLQEALSNARRHAPGSPVDVVTEFGATELAVVVRNRVEPDGDAGAGQPAPGHGIIGMRERAEFVGGRLDVGPAPGGAWRVRLAVPRPTETVGARSAPTTETKETR